MRPGYGRQGLLRLSRTKPKSLHTEEKGTYILRFLPKAQNQNCCEWKKNKSEKVNRNTEGGE